MEARKESSAAGNQLSDDISNISAEAMAERTGKKDESFEKQFGPLLLHFDENSSEKSAEAGRESSIDIPGGTSSSYKGTPRNDTTEATLGEGSRLDYQVSAGKDRLDVQGNGEVDVNFQKGDNITASDGDGEFFSHGDPEAENVTNISVGDTAKVNFKEAKSKCQEQQPTILSFKPAALKLFI